jgi:nucleoid-associated protein YgaU
MNIRAYCKQFGVATLVLGLAAGCAQQATVSEAPPPEDECQISDAARNAIDAAKAAAAEAQAVAYAWRDTEKLIKQAEAAAKEPECDNDKAIALANQARRQAENALRQYQAENAKFMPSAPPAAAPMAEKRGRYEVETGDSLWVISGMDFVYGDPYRWPLIFRENTAIIEDADLIFPGQWLEFRHSPGQAEVDAAVNHARNRGAWALGAVEASDLEYLSNN